MARFDRQIYRGGYWNGGDGATLGLDEDDRTIEHGPGSTHPGAQHGAVGGRLMVRMVPGVFNRLRLSEPADGQDTEHQQNRQNFEEAVVHRQTTHDTFGEMIMNWSKPCQAGGLTSTAPLIIGFVKKIVYTASVLVSSIVRSLLIPVQPWSHKSST